MDRLAVREASGHVSVVGLAPLGTALTEHHVDTLTDLIGLHRPIAVAFDPDPAGQQATLAAWELPPGGWTTSASRPGSCATWCKTSPISTCPPSAAIWLISVAGCTPTTAPSPPRPSTQSATVPTRRPI